MTEPRECVSHSLPEGGAVSVFLFYCVQVVCGDWPEEQRDGIKRGPAQASSLSYPNDSQPACGVGLGPLDCDKLELCVRCCVSQTPFSFELLNNRYVRGSRGKKLGFFFLRVLTLFMGREAGKILVFYFFLVFYFLSR